METGGWSAPCIRCDEAPAVDEYGFCGHCHWMVRVELAKPLLDLDAYLRGWARFADWLVANGRA